MSAKTPAGEIILAIDGGQSSTVCLIGAPDGTLLASGMGGPANLALHRGARPLMRAALEGAVGQACARLDPAAREAQAAYLSLTGGIGLALEMLPQLIPCRRMLAESDTLAALASGTLGGPGIVLIAGTGAVALALDASGRRVVHGGYGFLLGDEGSGYWIGKQAVLGAIRYYDGRGESSDLFPQVLKQLNAAGPRELAGLIYADRVKRRDVAGLCPLVIAAAEKGDRYALRIAEQAARELSALAISTAKDAALSAPEEKVIVLAGGVLRPPSLIREQCAQAIQAALPDYRVISPRYPAVVGAFLLALRLADVAIEPDVLARIEASLPAIPAEHIKGWSFQA